MFLLYKIDLLYLPARPFLIYICCNLFFLDAHTHGDNKLCKLDI